MARFSYTALAITIIIYVSFCGANPRPNTRTVNVKTATDNGSSKIPLWLRSAILSANQVAPNNNIQEEADTSFDYANKQDGTTEAAEDSLPVLIHKEDEVSGIKLNPSSVTNADKVNPFVKRSKRSTCTAPANLPQMVKDLNQNLSSSQLVGLNPPETTPTSTPASQPNTCPKGTTGDWWPRTEVNLRSICPWKLQQVDLGVDAFPRYVNNAICMCSDSCIGSSSMRCKEVTYDVTYLMRMGCENGLARFETRNHTVNIGCHCVSGSQQVAPPNQISE